MKYLIFLNKFCEASLFSINIFVYVLYIILEFGIVFSFLRFL